MSDFVKVEREGRVAVLALDRPPVNAMSGEVLRELVARLRGAAEDDGVGAIVLRGEGERAFSAGADITGFGQISDDPETPRGIQPVADLIESLPKPVVVAMHGHSLGGGLELALACDVRLAAEDARIGLPEVKLALLPGGGGTQRLPRVVGPARAALMIMSGDPISGRQAYEWGLVEQVVPFAELREAAVAVAARLAERSPYALAKIKELLRETRKLPDYAREFEAFVECLGSEDGQEGMAAFVEKREPRWAGR